MGEKNVEPISLEDRVTRLEDALFKRGQIDKDRRTGDSPISIDKLGDLITMWATTGEIAASGTSTIYLTDNRQPGGANIFSKTPHVFVMKDGVGVRGGMVRSSGPPSPSAAFSLSSSQVPVSIVWVPANEVWSVVVTNNTASASDFAVLALGV